MQLHYTTSYFGITYGLRDIADSLATVDAQGGTRLLFSTYDSNWLRGQEIEASSPQDMGDITWDRHIGPNFAYQLTDGAARIFNFSAFNYPLRMINVLANGAPSAPANVPVAQGSALTDVSAMQVMEFASGDLAAIAQRSVAGLTLFSLSNSGTLTLVAQIEDRAKTYLDQVSDTALLMRGADQLLLAISPLENGISSYRISADGSSSWIDSLGADNGLPAFGLSMMQTANIGGTDFVILAATQSSTLTVLRVNEMGVFFQTDSVFDTRDTRFDDIVAFDTFVSEGRLFVVAAGSDAGLTLFELLPNGRLSHVETFVLEGGQGLQAVTAIAAVVAADTVQIMMVDARSDRILQYDLTIDTLGGRMDAAAGDGLDNLIWGSDGADTLDGGGGDDFIFDGAGADQLTGGAGADVFVFALDGAQDHITDFATGQDRIDLSDWGRIYSASTLSISATATGATISYGDESLLITSANGTAVTLTDADFIF